MKRFVSLSSAMLFGAVLTQGKESYDFKDLPTDDIVKDIKNKEHIHDIDDQHKKAHLIKPFRTENVRRLNKVTAVAASVETSVASEASQARKKLGGIINQDPLDPNNNGYDELD